MWICTTKGMVSIKQDSRMEDVLVVRARARKVLERLFPDYKEYVQAVGQDYPYRIFVTKELVAEIISQEILDIDYGNFKNTVSDPEYSRFLMTTWGQGLRMEDEDAKRQFRARLIREEKSAKNLTKPTKKTWRPF